MGDHDLAVQLQGGVPQANNPAPIPVHVPAPAPVVTPKIVEPERSRDSKKKEKGRSGRSRSRSSSRSKKNDKPDTGGWSVAYVPEDKGEFVGWGFKNAPPAWQ